MKCRPNLFEPSRGNSIFTEKAIRMPTNTTETVTSLTSQNLVETQTIDVKTRSFWFLFPFTDIAEYRLSYYNVESTPSTNDLAFTLPLPQEHELQIVSCEEQTAGRGQGGNSWESERGKNLTFSIVCRAEFVEPARQFSVLQAAALAVRHVLSKISSGVRIKWPNDIYIGECKVSGTLIQCDIEQSAMLRMVIGIGVDVNQTSFTGGAPNAGSLAQLMGRDFSREGLLHSIVERFAEEYDTLRSSSDYIMQRYVSHLYRNQGMHCYRDANGEFEAEFVGVSPDGHLTLRDAAGAERVYAFKEVAYIV